jgi:hypothetical protein
MYGKGLYHAAFRRGYDDAKAGLAYQDRDGTPPHRMIVFVPGRAFSSQTKRGYRDGWNLGQAVPSRSTATQPHRSELQA